MNRPLAQLLYRQKVLLALLEQFGGSLPKTSCQKLVFGLCYFAQVNHYDFFPYKYGGYSHTLARDKQRLSTLGYLAIENTFSLNKNLPSFFRLLTLRDQQALVKVRRETKGLKGRKLLRKFYLEHPYLAHKSEVLNTVLQKSEVDIVRKETPNETAPGLFTLGYEGSSIDGYLDKLIRNNIKAVLDVRKNPVSRKYGFSREMLSKFLEHAGISYYHLPNLGVDSALRKTLDDPLSYKKLFSYYNKNVLPKNQASIKQIESLAKQHSRIALTCFESDHLSCHRHLVANHLKESVNLNVTHLS